MRYVIPLFISLLIGQMGTALANTQAFGLGVSANEEIEIQYTETGDEYVHGDHCMDGRVF